MRLHTFDEHTSTLRQRDEARVNKRLTTLISVVAREVVMSHQ